MMASTQPSLFGDDGYQPPKREAQEEAAPAAIARPDHLAPWEDWPPKPVPPRAVNDTSEAIAARDKAIDRVDANADDDWKVEADRAAADIANSKKEFTSDEVFDLMDSREIARPQEPRAMGPVMQRLVHKKLAVATDRMKNSTHKSCHARPKRVYRSLVFKS